MPCSIAGNVPRRGGRLKVCNLHRLRCRLQRALHAMTTGHFEQDVEGSWLAAVAVSFQGEKVSWRAFRRMLTISERWPVCVLAI